MASEPSAASALETAELKEEVASEKPEKVFEEH